MNKKVLESLLHKAYINSGDDSKVRLEAEGNNILLKSLITSERSATISSVTIEDFELEDSKILLCDPKRLLKILSIHEDDIDVRLFKQHNIYTKMLINDKSFNSEFSLGDPSIIEKLPDADEPEAYTINLQLNTEFIDKFTKAKKANPETTTFFVFPEKKTLVFVIGDNNSYSNKIKFILPLKKELKFNKMHFAAETLNNILAVNKNIEYFNMSIYDQGLMKLSFLEKVEEKEIYSDYFLIAFENI